MRTAIITLAFFCAILSGWTAALAQVRDLGGQAMMHHGSGETMSHDPSCDSHLQGDQACHHPAKAVHPFLCAACFAVAIDFVAISLREPVAAKLPVAVQQTLHAVIPEPLFPPPKAMV